MGWNASEKPSPEKWSPKNSPLEKESSGKRISGNKNLGKMVPGNKVLRKMVPDKMIFGKMVPGKMIPEKMVPRKMVLGKIWTTFLFLSIDSTTHTKRCLTFHLTILHAPNYRTLKESRKFCCRVLGFHRLITSQHSTHTTMLDAHPTIFCFQVLGLLSSFGFS